MCTSILWDLSLAPTAEIGDSVARILEEMGLETVGTHGTVAALALLNDAVKKGGLMACSHVGGLSGSFIPISEDAGMIDSVAAGHITLDKLEAMTAICSVGLDMVAVPGDTSAATLAAMIADEAAIGVMNHKTTAVRVIPAVGLGVGDTVEFGGLLGRARLCRCIPHPQRRSSPAVAGYPRRCMGLGTRSKGTGGVWEEHSMLLPNTSSQNFL